MLNRRELMGILGTLGAIVGIKRAAKETERPSPMPVKWYDHEIELNPEWPRTEAEPALPRFCGPRFYGIALDRAVPGEPTRILIQGQGMTYNGVPFLTQLGHAPDSYDG